MKPLHIVLLVVAGAVGGAVLLTVAQRTRRPAPAPVVAQIPAPAPPAASVPEPAPAPGAAAAPESAPAAPAEPEKPSPVTPRRTAPRPQRVRPAAPPANPRPMAVETQAPAPALEPVRAAAAEPPAAQPVAPPPAAPARVEPEAAAPPPPAPPHKVTLNAGTLIPVRLVDGLSSERNSSGDVFTATMDKPLVVDGFVIAERGARVEGQVVSADRGGKVKGVAALAVEITRIHTADGQTVAVQSDSFERRAEQTQKQDAAKVGIGAAVGAAIGAIAGGGKGAAIGAGVGGGAGAGDVLLTRGKPATLPSETRISFRLRAPVTVTERRD